MSSCGGSGPIRMLLSKKRSSSQDLSRLAEGETMPAASSANAPTKGIEGGPKDKERPKAKANKGGESAVVDKGKKDKDMVDAGRGKVTILVNVYDCKWRVVKSCIKRRGWVCVREEDATEWDIFWSDTEHQNIRITGHQKINHFPGMYGLARKNFLAHNLSQMKKMFPDDYDYFPMTWVLPDGYESLRTDMSRGKGRVYISKPDNSSQGKGIFLIRSLENIPRDRRCVIQRYIDQPYLIDGLKFDLRIYVLVTSCIPLRIYLFDEGLGRFCTESYERPTEDNLSDVYKHLTNYAINKRNENFEPNTDPNVTDRGSKRSLAAVKQSIRDAGHNVDIIWERISDLVIKTMISVQPSLEMHYRSAFGPNNDGFSCFEIMGFDVLLDSELKPWLLEVNHAPSLRTDSPFDKTVKRSLVTESLDIVNMRIEDKVRFSKQKWSQLRSKSIGLGNHDEDSMQSYLPLTLEERDKYESTKLVHFTKIYPTSDPIKSERYQKYLENVRSLSNTLFSDTAAFAHRKQAVGSEKESKDGQTHGFKSKSTSALNEPTVRKEPSSSQQEKENMLMRRQASAQELRTLKKQERIDPKTGSKTQRDSRISQARSAPSTVHDSPAVAIRFAPPPPSPKSESEDEVLPENYVFSKYESIASPSGEQGTEPSESHSHLSAQDRGNDETESERSDDKQSAEEQHKGRSEHTHVHVNPNRESDEERRPIARKEFKSFHDPLVLASPTGNPKEKSPLRKEYNIEISSLATAMKSAHLSIMESSSHESQTKKTGIAVRAKIELNPKPKAARPIHTRDFSDEFSPFS